MDLSRVVVIGTSSSGKTTFAGRLAAAVGSPCCELDAVYWGPRWTPRPDFRPAVPRSLPGLYMSVALLYGFIIVGCWVYRPPRERRYLSGNPR